MIDLSQPSKLVVNQSQTLKGLLPILDRRERSPRRDPGAGSAFRVARLSLSQSGSGTTHQEVLSLCETFCKQILLEGNPVTSRQVLKAITIYVKQKDAVNRISKRTDCRVLPRIHFGSRPASLVLVFWSMGVQWKGGSDQNSGDLPLVH